MKSASCNEARKQFFFEKKNQKTFARGRPRKHPQAHVG
jgi:hypothetical protein